MGKTTTRRQKITTVKHKATKKCIKLPPRDQNNYKKTSKNHKQTQNSYKEKQRDYKGHKITPKRYKKQT